MLWVGKSLQSKTKLFAEQRARCTWVYMVEAEIYALRGTCPGKRQRTRRLLSWLHVYAFSWCHWCWSHRLHGLDFYMLLSWNHIFSISVCHSLVILQPICSTLSGQSSALLNFKVMLQIFQCLSCSEVINHERTHIWWRTSIFLGRSFCNFKAGPP